MPTKTVDETHESKDSDDSERINPGVLSWVEEIRRVSQAVTNKPGRVFASRYRSALIQPGQWILPVLIWLDQLPVQLGYVDKAEAWPWSSAASHTGNTTAAPAQWQSDHADYWACGNTPFDRQANYRKRLQDGLSREETQRIDQAVSGQWALGGPAFIASLAHTASRRVAPGQRGRPRKKPAAATPAFSRSWCVV